MSEPTERKDANRKKQDDAKCVTRSLISHITAIDSTHKETHAKEIVKAFSHQEQ